MKKIIKILRSQEETIALAESVTGGYASYLLTKTPGSSEVFKLGAVVYSLFAKEKLLRLSKKHLLKTNGVSPLTVKLLAQAVKKKARSSIGAAIVGYAGPEAPKGQKGIVHMAVSTGAKTVVKSQKFRGPRDTVRKKAAQALITFIGEVIGI
ncbi:MAG: CinA family protein [Candidatus Omnitrophica bacterium]|nr:CinA family protein [Candidatus Omnitrophota bacterium]